MNKVVLVGRLTRDPDTGATANSRYARFAVAVDRRFKSEGGPEADFPSCVAFGKTAEFIEKYFHKGMKIGLEGRIQTGSYTNKEGAKVYTTDVLVENVEFVESKKAAEEASKNAAPEGFNNPPPISEADLGWLNVPEGEDSELPFA